MDAPFDTILGHDAAGSAVGSLTLANKELRVALTNYGARMVAIEAADRDGRFDHVLLGFDRADMVLKAGSFGAVIGRYANRIAEGRFTLDGVTYQLSRNDGTSTLHGGAQSFAKRFWTLVERSPELVVFTLESQDGDQGFPGAVQARATYRLRGAALHLTLEATTTKATPINMTAHPYFNLAGSAAFDINDQALAVAASTFLPTDARQIPTGERRAVAGTPFDFRTPVVIGSRVRGDDPQLLVARGFDHHFILDDDAARGVSPAVRMTHAPSGRVLEIATDQPGVQVYTGNSLNGSLVGHGGTYRQTAGIAFEPQAYPDAPNQPSFPSTVVRPGEVYRKTIEYRFSTDG